MYVQLKIIHTLKLLCISAPPFVAPLKIFDLQCIKRDTVESKHTIHFLNQDALGSRRAIKWVGPKRAGPE